MNTSLCSLAAVAAVITTLVVPPAGAMRSEPGPAAWSAPREEPGLDLVVRPGRIEVLLYGPGDQPLSALGASGQAVIEVNGRRLGVALLPVAGNRMVAEAPFRAGDSVVAEVTVKLDGETLTARYSGL
jgi:hypothetical protein